MSLSTQDRPENPSKFRLEISGGTLHYYDRDEGSNINVPVPFEFIMLDQLGTIKGWSDNDNSGYWSNEVKSSGKDAFTIRTSKGIKATGLWKEIKNDPNVSGSKFNAVAYIAHRGAEGLQISRIYFQGAALNAWIEFIQANRGVSKGKSKVVLSGFSDAKKGSVKYQVPVFETVPINDEEIEIATELDRELQEYFAENTSYALANTSVAETLGVDEVVLEDIDDESINLADIPF